MDFLLWEIISSSALTVWDIKSSETQAQLSFCRMKRLGVLLLAPRWHDHRQTVRLPQHCLVRAFKCLA